MSSRPASALLPASPRARKALAALAIVLAACILVVAGLGIAALTIVGEGKASLAQADGAAAVSLVEGATTDDGGATVEYEGARYARNERMATVCFLGVDREGPARATEGAGQADAVVVAAVNLETSAVDLIGVPRESMVEVDELGSDGSRRSSQDMALCLAYAFGDGGHASCENTARAASRALCGVPVTRYLALDLGGIVAVNDAADGVRVTALETIPDTGIVEGRETLLLGEDARAYVQWRDEAVLESPLARQARQAQYLEAFAAQLPGKVLANPGMATDLYEALSDHTTTNLSMSEAAYLASTLVLADPSNLQITTLAGEMRHGESYGEFHLDERAVFETVLETYYHRVD